MFVHITAAGRVVDTSRGVSVRVQLTLPCSQARGYLLGVASRMITYPQLAFLPTSKVVNLVQADLKIIGLRSDLALTSQTLRVVLSPSRHFKLLSTGRLAGKIVTS